MVKEPESMEELIYFTQRAVDKGTVKAWVYKSKCPKCGKALMGKPINEKTGKVKIRAKEYLCPECGYMVEKQAYEETLTCEVKYKCPACDNEDEIEVPFKRRRFQKMDAIVFECQKCETKIPITKKMKESKK